MKTVARTARAAVVLVDTSVWIEVFRKPARIDLQRQHFHARGIRHGESDDAGLLAIETQATQTRSRDNEAGAARGKGVETLRNLLGQRIHEENDERFVTVQNRHGAASAELGNSAVYRALVRRIELAGLAGLCVVLVQSAMALASGGYNPFIYFRF